MPCGNSRPLSSALRSTPTDRNACTDSGSSSVPSATKNSRIPLGVVESRPLGLDDVVEELRRRQQRGEWEGCCTRAA